MTYLIAGIVIIFSFFFFFFYIMIRDIGMKEALINVIATIIIVGILLLSSALIARGIEIIINK